VAGLKKTGGRLGSLPPEETVDQYRHLKSSISRPWSGTFKAGLIRVLRVGDKLVKAERRLSNQKLFSLSCLALDCDLESSKQLNMLFHFNEYSVLYLIHGEPDTNGIASLVKTDFSKRCLNKLGS